jgi:large subunit ribosomal protein L21
MYAVFQLSGFQFKAEEGQTVKVPLQSGDEGTKIDIAEVLMVKAKDKVLVGAPFVEGASIKAEVVGSERDAKVSIYKYKRRTKYRRRAGHRQDFTTLKIKKIVTP